ncbi:MAG: S1C family serine protease [Bacteroidota bacterium]
MNDPSLTGREKFRKRFSALGSRLRWLMPFLSGVLAALLALFIYSALTPNQQLTRSEVDKVVANAMASATPRPPDSVGVYQIIQPSLVLIETERPGENGEADMSLGSGTVINADGQILTALHVVDNATKISLTFADGTKAEGKVVFTNPDIDIAMVSSSVLPQILVPATIGNPGALRVGDEAYVVGNPFGLYSSMSAGVISGFDRVYHPQGHPKPISGLIQIDAAVNPGTSGGPLLNSSGYVVGVVTGIVNPTKDSFFIGIGFAVPINVAAGGGGGLPPY